MSNGTMNIKDALEDPELFYGEPDNIVNDVTLDDDQKRQLLDAWRADAEEMQTAEGEGMGGGESSKLDAVLAAIELI